MNWKPYIDIVLMALYGWACFIAGYHVRGKSIKGDPIIEMPKRGPGPVDKEMDDLEDSYINEGDFGG